jgi:hypothetical protein
MIQGQWKSDGTDADGKTTWSTTPSDTEGVSMEVNVPGGSPMNLIYGMTPTPMYYLQVTVTEMASRSSSLSVGVVRPEEFHKGYKCKGMFYNGNLTNGSAALKTSYGPFLQTGDVVVVEYVEAAEEEQVQMIVHLNGACLGTAFQVAKGESSFVPCIHVNGEMTLQAKVLSEKPKLAPRDVHPLVGKWELVEAIGEGFSPIWPGGNNLEDKEMVLSIEKHEDTAFEFSLRVYNTLNIQLQVTGNADTGFQLDGAEGKVMSTKMMPPPPFYEIETKLSNCMESGLWNSMELVPDKDNLAILDDSDLVVAKLTRLQQSTTEAALTSYNT